MRVAGRIPFSRRKVREFRNQNVGRRLTQMAPGAQPHLNQTLIDNEPQSLVDGVLLNPLQDSPPLGSARSPENSKRLRR
jgi:hypothetical protein